MYYKAEIGDASCKRKKMFYYVKSVTGCCFFAKTPLDLLVYYYLLFINAAIFCASAREP